MSTDYHSLIRSDTSSSRIFNRNPNYQTQGYTDPAVSTDYHSLIRSDTSSSRIFNRNPNYQTQGYTDPAVSTDYHSLIRSDTFSSRIFNRNPNCPTQGYSLQILQFQQKPRLSDTGLYRSCSFNRNPDCRTQGYTDPAVSTETQTVRHRVIQILQFQQKPKTCDTGLDLYRSCSFNRNPDCATQGYTDPAVSTETQTVRHRVIQIP